MVFHIRCPNAHIMQIEEQHLGKQVRCPTCNVVLTVAAPVAAPAPSRPAIPPPAPPVFNLKPEPPQEIVPPPRKPADAKTNAQRMRLARVGLAFHYARILLVLVSVLSMVLLMLLLGIRGNTNVAPALKVAMVTLIAAVVGVAILCLVFFPFLSVIGSLLCLGVPAKTGAKAWIILSFVMELLGLLPLAGSLAFALAKIGGSGWSLADDARLGADLLAGLGYVTIAGLLAWSALSFVAWAFFALFLRGIFVFAGDSFIATETYSLLIQSVVLAVLTPVWCVITPHLGAAATEKLADATAGEVTTGLLFFIWALVWVWLLLRVLTVVKCARGTLEKWV